jgi:hypothetical protein
VLNKDIAESESSKGESVIGGFWRGRSKLGYFVRAGLEFSQLREKDGGQAFRCHPSLHDQCDRLFFDS